MKQKLNKKKTCKTPVLLMNSETKIIGGKTDKINTISKQFSEDEKNFHPCELIRSA